MRSKTLVAYFVLETKRWLQYLQEHGNGQSLKQDTIDESMIGMLRRFKSLSEECQKFLAMRVPKYAVPSIAIPLARMPLSKCASLHTIHISTNRSSKDPNGKIDRPSLPFPDATDLAILNKRRGSSIVAKMTETQTRLAKV